MQSDNPIYESVCRALQYRPLPEDLSFYAAALGGIEMKFEIGNTTYYFPNVKQI